MKVSVYSPEMGSLDKQTIFGCVGSGQAGGNIADVFQQQGYPSIAINTSKQDLDALRYVKGQYLVPGGSGGAGKNRRVGFDGIAHNLPEVLNFIDSNMPDAVKVLFVAGSAGGGTGSGQVPVLAGELALANNERRCVGAILALPEETESAGAIANAMQSVSELTEIDVVGPVLLIDNGRGRQLYPNLEVGQFFETLNAVPLRTLDRVAHLAFGSSSMQGNFDPADLWRVLNTRGNSLVTSVELNENDVLDPAYLAERIHESWRDNVFAPVSISRILRAAFVYELPPEYTTFIDDSAVLKLDGRNPIMPIETFRGVYSLAKGGRPCVHTILTGIDWPHSRLQQLDNLLAENKDALTSALQRNRDDKFKSSNAGWLDDVRGSRAAAGSYVSRLQQQPEGEAQPEQGSWVESFRKR